MIYLRFSAVSPGLKIAKMFKYFAAEAVVKYSMIYEGAGSGSPAPDVELIVERDDPPKIITCVILTLHVTFSTFVIFNLPHKRFWKNLSIKTFSHDGVVRCLCKMSIFR